MGVDILRESGKTEYQKLSLIWEWEGFGIRGYFWGEDRKKTKLHLALWAECLPSKFLFVSSLNSPIFTFWTTFPLLIERSNFTVFPPAYFMYTSTVVAFCCDTPSAITSTLSIFLLCLNQKSFFYKLLHGKYKVKSQEMMENNWFPFTSGDSIIITLKNIMIPVHLFDFSHCNRSASID